MSAMNIDRPLDEMVSDARKAKKTAARGTGKKPRGAAGPARGGRAAALPAVAAATANALQPYSDQVRVSDLPEDVTESQVRDLFVKTVGPVHEVNMNYDAKGKSKGTVEVRFKRPADANKAVEKYNNRLIDGRRAMKVALIFDPSKRPPAPLAARLSAGPRGSASSTVAAASGASGAGRAKAGAGGRGGGRGRGRRGGAGDRPKLTADALDAEMDDWHKEGDKVTK